MNREQPPNKSYQGIEDLFERLYAIIKKLRGPGGCAWDREQTPYTMRASLIEEAYEIVSAIDEKDDDNLKEEIGDLFLILVMISRLKEEEGSFTLREVLEGICQKLIRRHPHVFGNEKKDSVAEILKQWERIKRDEEGKQTKGSILENAPRTLPPLGRAFLIQKKVSGVGFDWENPKPVWDKLEEEIAELREAFVTGENRRMEDEFGDLLFTVVNLCRLLKVDPSLALNRTNQKFIRRFKMLERRVDAKSRRLEDMNLEQMDVIWNQIKKEEEENRSK
jgi:tetrapyrrole methylase family protein/MazG family protein